VLRWLWRTRQVILPGHSGSMSAWHQMRRSEAARGTSEPVKQLSVQPWRMANLSFWGRRVWVPLEHEAIFLWGFVGWWGSGPSLCGKRVLQVQ
jgi:hypothetical protein